MSAEETYNGNDFNNESEKIDFKQIFFDYFVKYWYLYVMSLIICLMIGYYYAWYATPIYGARATVLIKLTKGGTGPGGVLDDLSSFTDDRNIQNEIEVLKSRSLISKTLKSLEFDISYFQVGNMKIREIYQDCPFKVIDDSLKFKSLPYPVQIHIINDKKFRLTYNNPKPMLSFLKSMLSEN